MHVTCGFVHPHPVMMAEKLLRRPITISMMIWTTELIRNCLVIISINLVVHIVIEIVMGLHSSFSAIGTGYRVWPLATSTDTKERGKSYISVTSVVEIRG